MERGKNIVIGYKIGEVAKITGLNPQTIRRYESSGILEGLRTGDAGFRTYSPAELAVLIRIRLYRNFGFSLDEVQALLNESVLQNLTAFQSKRQELEQERFLIDCKLECLAEQTRALEEAAIWPERCTISTRPPMLGISYRHRLKLEKNPKLWETLAQWVTYTPWCAPCFSTIGIISLGTAQTPPQDMMVGLCIPQKYADIFGFWAG